ncbi:TetR/AcrR family transcriptional regulator [Homoserinibacter sp. GY 40078]|uniref:TetR/AcrR family transcriptional regulator n=1 Tax=Homoserinibacter sp. GY 40078 TaxID=2603275 RepID=UPI0011C7EBE4|nr:TetR/AcrR family transcriptional regulator [Homoserinibacter sp. GY 40078]TXK19110.1 TetR/AcrR family transcriptional regulator [Homoserinibacter sp. GY 40078]
MTPTATPAPTHTQPTPARDDHRLRIIQAAAGLLTAHGATALTTRAVAEAAGVQAPTIYRLFGDKDGLVEAVAEHVMSAHVAEKAAGSASGDPIDDLRLGWDLQIDFALTHPELYELLNRSGRAGASPAMSAGIDVLRGRIRRLASAGIMRVSEERALWLIHAAGAGAVVALLEAPPERRDRGLADALFDSVLAAIVDHGAAPVASHDVVPAAVALAAQVSELPGLSPEERALLGQWLTRAVDAANETRRG